MNHAFRRMTFGLLVSICATASVHAQFREEPDPTDISVSGRTPETIIITWPTYSYRLARMMIAKYGQPTESLDDRLVWLDNGSWKKTVVYREAASGRVFNRNKGRLEQSVAYRMPHERLDALTRYDKHIESDPEESRLTTRGDSESDNFLALNLADDVINGRRSPHEAATFRTKLSRMASSGKSSSYLDGLMFVPKDQFADPESPD